VDQATELTLELATPLQPLVGQGEVVRTLELREPTAGELAKASVGNGIESKILDRRDHQTAARPDQKHGRPRLQQGDGFFIGVSQFRPRNWRELCADLTFYFHWSPRDVWELTMTEILWWAAQAERQIAARRRHG
jgi:hypothetical protein